MESKNIVIDIREEHEILENKLEPNDSTTIIFNIPMRHIGFNKDLIKQFSKTNKIFITCKSGNRSKRVKDLYFSKSKNIYSVDGGYKNVENTRVIKKSGGFGLMQYMQTVFVLILISLLCMHYYNFNNKIIIRFIVFVLIFILYQLLTKSCIMSKYLPLS
jgi:rhodanese-related sulfurtransferase